MLSPYPKHTLDVVPDRSPEAGRVDVLAAAHRVIRQVVSSLELVV